MNLTKVESSNIEAIGYEGTVLYVQFKTGNVYSYSPISEEVYKALMSAESKGKYFSANIRNNPQIHYQVVNLSEKTIERIDTLLGSKTNVDATQPQILAGKGVVKI